MRIICVMFNIFCLIGRVVSVYVVGLGAMVVDVEQVEYLLMVVGLVFVLEERYIDVVIGFFGLGLVYVYLLIEVMIEGGVVMGLFVELVVKLVV